MFVYLILCIALFTLPASSAYAWGPGTHLETALEVLTKLAFISPAIAAVIKRHQKAFLYGSVSADVVVGKKYAGHRYHCHTWGVGRELLESSKTPVQKAAAYGYLVHLAADVVAHNYYIPYKIIRSFKTRLLTHTYWEMRFDVHVKNYVWKSMEELLKGDFEDFDKLLEKSFRNTLFSFPTNRRIFRSILILQKERQMRTMLKVYAGKSRWSLESGDVSHYRGLINEAVFDFLKKGFRARCLKADPSGWLRIRRARELRKELKFLKRKGLVHPQEISGILKSLKLELRKTMYRPESILPGI